jgi:dUTP pyrophosphatase
MKECPIKILTGMNSISMAYETPACFDIHTNIPYPQLIVPKSRVSITTGIKAQIHPNYWVKLLSKSGLSLKGLEVGAGVIDSDYTGEWIVILYNHSKSDVILKANAKIAQASVYEKIRPVFIQADSLEETERGEKGFGSSGQ